MRGKKTKEYILKKASEVFSHFGFYKTAMDDIAELARVGKGTLYYYFKSKYELFSEVLLQEAKKLIENVQNKINDKDDIEERILHASIAHIKELKHNQLLQETLTDEKLLEIPDIYEAVSKMRKLLINFFREMLENCNIAENIDKLSNIMVELIFSLSLLPPHVSTFNEENISIIVKSLLKGETGEG